MQILPGLYIGTLKDSQDRGQLKNNHITHIVSVIEDARPNPSHNVIKIFLKILTLAHLLCIKLVHFNMDR